MLGANTIPDLFERDDGSEPGFAFNHGIYGKSAEYTMVMAMEWEITKCLVGFFQREFLNHAVDVLQLRERDRLFAVCNMTGWPANDGKSLLNLLKSQVSHVLRSVPIVHKTYQRDGIDRNLARSCTCDVNLLFSDLARIILTGKNKQLPKHTQSAYQGLNRISMRCCCNNQRRPSKLLQRLSGVDLRGINILVSTQLSSKLLLLRAPRERNDAPSKLVCILDGQMAEATKSLNGDGCAWSDVHATHRGENRDTCAENRGILGCVDVLWHADDGFAVHLAVFGVLHMHV